MRDFRGDHWWWIFYPSAGLLPSGFWLEPTGKQSTLPYLVRSSCCLDPSWHRTGSRRKKVSHLVFYVRNMTRVLGKARAAEQKQSKMEAELAEMLVLSGHCQPTSLNKWGGNTSMFWALNSGRKLVLNPALGDGVQAPTENQLKMTNTHRMQNSMKKYEKLKSQLWLRVTEMSIKASKANTDHPLTTVSKTKSRLKSSAVH